MGILDYIFKSREQRERKKEEAEKRRDQELLDQADRLFEEKKYDECLKICLQLVNRNFFGVGYWYAYLHAVEILYRRGRYREVIEVSKHYKWFCDKDSDRHMDWYVSMSKQAIEEQENPKPAPKPKPETPPAHVATPDPDFNPNSEPAAQELPKPEIHVPKRDDDKRNGEADMRSFPPPARPTGIMDRSGNLYQQYLRAIKELPPFDLLDTPVNLPKDAVESINRIKAEARDLLDRAEACARKEDWRAATEHYEYLLVNKYWEPEPYDALIKIYEHTGRHKEAQAVRSKGLHAMNSVQRRMKNELLEAARKIDAEELALDMMEKGEKVIYGLGLYTVYDPFPCIKRWERELAPGL